MSDLIIIAFKAPETAFEARAELAKLQKEYLIEMEDAVVVTRDDGGKVKLHQAVGLTGMGAVSGGLWGGLIGLLFLNPLLGAAVGAGAGAITGAISDFGIDDNFLKDVGQSLEPGGSALAILIRKMNSDRVLDRLSAFRDQGRVMQTSLPADVEERLRQHFGQARPEVPPVPAP